MKYIPLTLFVRDGEKTHRISGQNKYLLAQTIKTSNRFKYIYHDRNREKDIDNPIKGDDIYARISRALNVVFCSPDCKAICRRLRRKRNSHGVGLVGKVVDFNDGDEDSISYSKRGVSKKNHKRRTKLKLSRFLRRHVFQSTGLVNSVSDAELEQIQTIFTGGKFKVLSGRDAANVYEQNESNGTFRSSVTSNCSCMQGTDYNTPLFMGNKDKYRLLVYVEGDTIVARTKLYTNDDGTHFLGTRTYSCRSMRDMFEDYFANNFVKGPLCCTLEHFIGDSLPFIDETKDGYGMDRLNDSTIKLHQYGEHECESQDGLDPSYNLCCKCDLSSDEEIDGCYYCEDCANDNFANIDGEWYSYDDVFWSDLLSEYIHCDNAIQFITNENGDTDYDCDTNDLCKYDDVYYRKVDCIDVSGTMIPKWLCHQNDDGEWVLSE